jgi:hypothetical protein
MAVKALTQSNQEHLVLAQQIAETRAGGMTGLRGGGPWCITGQGSTHWSSRWQALCCCSFIWWSRQSRGGGIKSSFPFTQTVLPKLSGENPRIWIDKCRLQILHGQGRIMYVYFSQCQSRGPHNISDYTWINILSLFHENNLHGQGRIMYVYFSHIKFCIIVDDNLNKFIYIL